jgi:uncharacterized Zn finger protein
MAISSKCPSCGGFTFEVVEESPAGSAYKCSFVRCVGCGGVVGTSEFHNIGTLLLEQNKALLAIANKLEICVSLQTPSCVIGLASSAPSAVKSGESCCRKSASKTTDLLTP